MTALRGYAYCPVPTGLNLPFGEGGERNLRHQACCQFSGLRLRQAIKWTEPHLL